MTRRAWTALGLERTDDVAEIRRAYARKLKAIDPEDDPEAFIALRAAFEEALAEARYAVLERADLEAGQDGLAVPPELVATLPPAGWEEAPSSASTDEGAPPDEEYAAFRRLSELLFGADGDVPDPEALAAALREILDDHRMEGVAHAERAEQWLAAELYDSIPRSDPILAAAVAHFGWHADNARWDQPFLFAQLAERHKARLLIDRLLSPTHSHHGAYVELTREGTELGFNRFLIGADVRDLLDAVRKRCPMAEDWFNPERVAVWDQRHRRSVPAWRIFLWSLWVLVVLLGMLAR